MILSGHQPVYLPGLILFDKIAKSDIFMFVGHCQFVAKSWHIKNRIAGNLTLTVPVHKKFGKSINKTEIFGDHWKRKHLRSIYLTYKNRPYFNLYYPQIEKVITHPWKFLGDMNCALIVLIMPWFGINTKVCFSDEFHIQGHKTEMLISMCNYVNADTYLSSEGARAYVREDIMKEAGITHIWQDFKHPLYDQGRTFEPNLSALDLLFNCGPNAREFFIQ